MSIQKAAYLCRKCYDISQRVYDSPFEQGFKLESLNEKISFQLRQSSALDSTREGLVRDLSYRLEDLCNGCDYSSPLISEEWRKIKKYGDK